jgi:two-component system response regulator FlrC
MILIVEDDAVARGAMRSLLAACGYENVAVETAEEAMALLANGQIPDAAVVDWDLPGMSGLEFIEHLGKASPKTSTVLVTGAARERVEDAARRYGVAYMRKPLDFRNLLRFLPPREQPGAGSPGVSRPN